MAKRRMFRVDRFWAKVDKRGPDECWPWLGAVGNGRGLFIMEHGHMMTAPRAAYFFTRGGISKKWKFVCHSCDNPLCCNPHHLWLGDAKSNAQDYSRKLRRGDRPARVHARVRGKGMRQRGSTLQANVTHRGKTYWKTFPVGTSLDDIQRWRQGVLDAFVHHTDPLVITA